MTMRARSDHLRSSPLGPTFEGMFSWIGPLVLAMEARGFTQAEIMDLVPRADFVFWLRRLRRRGYQLKPEHLMGRFDVSRATAYRALPQMRTLADHVVLAAQQGSSRP